MWYHAYLGKGEMMSGSLVAAGIVGGVLGIVLHIASDFRRWVIGGSRLRMQIVCCIVSALWLVVARINASVMSEK